MSDRNDIRWALTRIEKRQARMESRQLGQREQNLIALLKLAVINDVVRAALGKEWTDSVYRNIEIS